MTPIHWMFLLFAAIAFLEKTWKFRRVQRFMRRPIPLPTQPVHLVSILQPILSGDPTLPDSLEATVRFQTGYARELIWLIDTDDPEAQRISQELAARYPQESIRIIPLPPPPDRQNPKMIKLIAGARLAQGEVVVVLDDDTRLPNQALEQCLPFLDEPGVGLVFGLPYYVSRRTIWSQWVAGFVNSHSLMTYIPYLQFSPPVTINGMFYALRRQTLAAIGGFEGLEHTLADDFAVAQRVRQHGLQLRQTPVVHGISTTVTSARHYFSLLQRWFIFPRESLLRHLTGREQMLIYGLALIPMFFALGFVGWALLWPTPFTGLALAAYLAYHYLIFDRFNRLYFQRALPWPVSAWVVVLQLILPLQILVALVSPQRVLWRGHTMEVERGGGFRLVRRRR